VEVLENEKFCGNMNPKGLVLQHFDFFKTFTRLWGELWGIYMGEE
jgi:hypothetical protein